MLLCMIASSGEFWFEVVFRKWLPLRLAVLLRTLSRSPPSNSTPLAGYEHRLRRIYFVLRREACLVQREAGSSTRIDKQQWLLEGHIAECPDERHLDFASRDGG